jgi:hypothetical protein
VPTKDMPAKKDRTTLIVAVAGIAATAVVGLAGAAATWLSARDDRATERALAREERTYDRRTAAYLDAVDFLERQSRELESFANEAYLPLEGSPRRPRAVFYDIRPSPRLRTRLRAFGSKAVFEAFERAAKTTLTFPVFYRGDTTDTSILRVKLPAPIAIPSRDFNTEFIKLDNQIDRFEALVHDEIG